MQRSNDLLVQLDAARKMLNLAQSDAVGGTVSGNSANGADPSLNTYLTQRQDLADRLEQLEARGTWRTISVSAKSPCSCR